MQNTICGSARSCSPDDGRNDARNMLRQKLVINIRLVASCWFLSLHPNWRQISILSSNKFTYRIYLFKTPNENC